MNGSLLKSRHSNFQNISTRNSTRKFKRLIAIACLMMSTVPFFDFLTTQKQQRYDYRELLKLITFLGDILQTGISFHIPAAAGHVRCMPKAIYAFNIYLFHDQCQLTNWEFLFKNNMYFICSFVYLNLVSDIRYE